MYKKILAAIDGSDGAARGLEHAIELAKLAGAELHIVSVEEHLPAYAATVGEMQQEERFEHRYFNKVQSQARRVAGERGIDAHFEIVAGHAADAILRMARQGGFDLIVMGHTGHSKLHYLVLGSTADRVVENARCSVLVAR